jgi:hypothetical protein
MLATDQTVSREAATAPALLIGRNSEPDAIPATLSQEPQWHGVVGLAVKAVSDFANGLQRAGEIFRDPSIIEGSLSSGSVQPLRLVFAGRIRSGWISVPADDGADVIMS